MPSEADSGLLELIAPDEPVLDSYLKEVVNRGLGRYKAIIQTGEKQGERLSTHVVNGALTLERLAPLLELSAVERRCLLLAYTIHDLNKVPPHDRSRARYVDIVTPANVRAELEQLGVDGFFPEWRDYLPDLVFLAHAHQGHVAVTAEGLDLTRAPRYRLGRVRLDQLGPLMAAVDVLDLSRTLAEARHKETFLMRLNAASPRKRFRFVHHRLGENRGILTNVVHNALVEHLRDRGAYPLLYYPEGVAYLVDAETTLSWDSGDLRSVARCIQCAVTGLQKGGLRQFIKSDNKGFIKVAKAALESGASLDQIFDVVCDRVAERRLSPGRRDQRAARLLDKDLRPALAQADPELREAIEEALAWESIFPANQEQFQLGELAAAYRWFLQEHCAKQLQAAGEKPWTRVYRVFGLAESRWPLYDAVDKTYRRHYILARDISPGSLEDWGERVLADVRALRGSAAEAESEPGGVDLFVGYLDQMLTVSFAPAAAADFGCELANYVRNRHRQCCYCGSPWPTAELMAANVPEGIGVQIFSNRLPGGGRRDPKRRVCQLCRLQLILEKVAWANGGTNDEKQATFYIHLFPHSFFPAPLLAAWREEVKRLRAEEHDAVFLDTPSYLRDWADRKVGPIKFTYKSRKDKEDLVLPLPTLVGNTPVLVLNTQRPGYSEQFLLALEKACVLTRFFGCRGILSRTAVPIVPPEGFHAMLVDGTPTNLRWLLPEDDMDTIALDRPTAPEGASLFGRLAVLHQVATSLDIPEDKHTTVWKLATAASEEPLALYHVVDRLIERKIAVKVRGRQDPGRSAIDLARAVVDGLRALLPEKEGAIVEALRALARIGWEQHIHGDLGSRNAILFPLDQILQALEQQPRPEDRDLVRAAVTEDIFQHLYRRAPADRKPGRGKREAVDEYVACFFDQVLDGAHHGDVNQAIQRGKLLRSAYLTFFRQAMPQGERGQTDLAAEP